MRISPSDITVSIPCIYQTQDPIWMMAVTCNRFGINPRPFGFGRQPSDWVDIMLRQMGEQARTCPTSHMLYTDSRDAFFLTGLDEIAEKYNAMGCPPLLMASDCVGFSSYQAWYDKIGWDISKPFPYFQVGGMLCEAKALTDAIDWMFQREACGDWGAMPRDNPPWWCNFMVERPGELVIDHGCKIFQSATMCLGDLFVVNPNSWEVRVHNPRTHSFPCLIHFNGGYTDQVTGKWERMEPMWRQLGYTENPPWEGK